MRPLLLLCAALALLFAPPAAAQVPDPRDPRGYFPLAVGNEWEYRLDLTRPASPGVPNTSRTEYVRLRVTAGAAGPDGDAFALVDSRYTDAGVLVRRDTAVVRFDPATASVRPVAAGPNGTIYGQPVPFFASDLDLLFGDPGEGPRLYWRSAGQVELEIPALTGSGAPVEAKEFGNFFYGFTAVHGIGFVRGAGGCEPCGPFSEFDEWTLTFARIGEQTYGTRVVAGEAGPPPDTRLNAYPNPTTGPLTLRSASAATAEVYDVLGRRIRSVALGTEATLSLAGLPAGVYVVRAGAQTARVTVR